MAWGKVEQAELERVVVVSPHLDDAVLGCGRLLTTLPGATVVTVFCGTPDPYPEPPTEWDALAGFVSGDDVLAARKAEDAAAMAVLGSEARHLDLVEYQYLPPESWLGGDDVAPVLEAELGALEPTAVFVPFGLANPDHVATGDACVSLFRRLAEPAWFCYEDFGYKHIPGQLALRIRALLDVGLVPTPAAVPVDPDGTSKRRAFSEYASQVRALEAEWDVWERLEAPVPEQYWRLAPPPDGWVLA